MSSTNLRWVSDANEPLPSLEQVATWYSLLVAVSMTPVDSIPKWSLMPHISAWGVDLTGMQSWGVCHTPDPSPTLTARMTFAMLGRNIRPLATSGCASMPRASPTTGIDGSLRMPFTRIAAGVSTVSAVLADVRALSYDFVEIDCAPAHSVQAVSRASRVLTDTSR